MGVAESKVPSRPDYNFYDDYLRRCTAVWNEMCKLNEYLKSNQELYKQIQNFEFVQKSRLLRKTSLHNFSERLKEYLKPTELPQRQQLEAELRNNWRAIESTINDIRTDYKLHLPDLDKYIRIPVPESSEQSSSTQSSYETLYSRMTWGKDPEILFLLMAPFWSNRFIRRYILEAVNDPNGRMSCFILSSASKTINTVSFECVSIEKRMRMGLPENPKVYIALFNFFGRSGCPGVVGDYYYNYYQLERVQKCKKDGCIHPFHWRVKETVANKGGATLNEGDETDHTEEVTVDVAFSKELMDLDSRLDTLSSIEMARKNKGV